MRMLTAVSALALGLTACSQQQSAGEAPEPATAPEAAIAATQPAEADSTKEPPAIRLYVLDCGHFDVSDMASFDRAGAYDGQPTEVVDPCFLIRHPLADLLWDTGLPDVLHEQAGGVTDPPFHLTMPKTLKGQLAEIGLAPEDIELLSLSHSHFDHVGNAGDYAGSTWLVAPAERELMFSDKSRANAESFAAYSALEKAETIEIVGDWDVFG